MWPPWLWSLCRRRNTRSTRTRQDLCLGSPEVRILHPHRQLWIRNTSVRSLLDGLPGQSSALRCPGRPSLRSSRLRWPRVGSLGSRREPHLQLRMGDSFQPADSDFSSGQPVPGRVLPSQSVCRTSGTEVVPDCETFFPRVTDDGEEVMALSFKDIVSLHEFGKVAKPQHTPDR